MELEDIKKLRPDERIKRLKELEEKRREEIDKAREMLRSSEHELRVEEELKDIPIPQVKAVNIDQLFGAEEKQIFRTKRFIPEEAVEVAPARTREEREERERRERGERESGLEERVGREQPVGPESGGPIYATSSERVKQNLKDLYNLAQENVFDEMREMRHRAATGTWSRDDEETLRYRIGQMQRAEQSEDYVIREEARQIFEQEKTIVDQIRSYRRRTGV